METANRSSCTTPSPNNFTCMCSTPPPKRFAVSNYSTFCLQHLYLGAFVNKAVPNRKGLETQYALQRPGTNNTPIYSESNIQDTANCARERIPAPESTFSPVSSYGPIQATHLSTDLESR